MKENIHERFVKEIDRIGYSQLNSLGLVACQTAYEGDGEWLERAVNQQNKEI